MAIKHTTLNRYRPAKHEDEYLTPEQRNPNLATMRGSMPTIVETIPHRMQKAFDAPKIYFVRDRSGDLRPVRGIQWSDYIIVKTEWAYVVAAKNIGMPLFACDTLNDASFCIAQLTLYGPSPIARNIAEENRYRRDANAIVHSLLQHRRARINFLASQCPELSAVHAQLAIRCCPPPWRDAYWVGGWRTDYPVAPQNEIERTSCDDCEDYAARY